MTAPLARETHVSYANGAQQRGDGSLDSVPVPTPGGTLEWNSDCPSANRNEKAFSA
eukprot:CAMPEP_0180790916 /NCGR_PEP_ID=MMETSP1038_2-20121128/53516_1 /TAXON_ID=632150 /ORGANISM="Azadinium spinosum, Strain 3D9" /LENGTH=55 /DNA_ID=CAMNT_0022828991 /DNA_START=74 /DNA_END=237 /DNA_ORIENTATION=+